MSDSKSFYPAGGMPHAHFLVGATASGKSAVAQYIAERKGHLIVSADSMNLYRGMNIGTAKPSTEARSTVDYAGIDLAQPTEKYSVAAYLEAVRPAFESRREIIVAGGTGLYIKCMTEGFDEVPPEDAALRRELDALEFHQLEKRARKDAPELYSKLTEDDRRNPRRLIRILEKRHGGTMSPVYSGSEEAIPSGLHSGNSWNSGSKPKLVGLHVEREELVRRIERRVEKMYASGLMDEARELIGLELSPTALQAIGYAEAFAVIRNEMTIDEAKEKTIIRTRQLAKRQMTWFRNQLDVEWIDTADYATMEKVSEAVSSAWETIGPIHIHI